jgi:predicted DNA repair protein MutK
LGSVAHQNTTIQILTVSAVALVATVGVYGIVALIVRMDDAGYKLIKTSNGKGFLSTLGKMLVNGLPIIIKILGAVGTVALILVSGGIFVHNVPFIHHLFPELPSIVKEFGAGLVIGLAAVLVMTAFKKVYAMVKK